MSKNTITIGGNEYVVKAAPIARIIKALNQLASPIKDIANREEDISVENAISTLVAQAGPNVETFIRAFVPTLSKGFLSDEEHGPSIPELIDTLAVIVRVNRIDTINNFFQKLVPPDQLKKFLTTLGNQVPQSTKSLNSVPKLTDGVQKKPKVPSPGQK